jgi:hypothetical protein
MIVVDPLQMPLPINHDHGRPTAFPVLVRLLIV